MGLGILRAIRICLLLLAFANGLLAIYGVKTGEHREDMNMWTVWLPLVLAIISDISYTLAVRAQRAGTIIIESNATRYTCAFFLCVAWLVSPSYVVNYIAQGVPSQYFFEVWNCSYDTQCGVWFAADLCGFLMAFFVFLEMIFAHRYERSSTAYKSDTSTTVIVGPALVQPAPQNSHLAPHQYVYGSAPSQPAAYYPQQPAMAAPYPAPTMPYQASATPYQVPQQAPAYQPYPPPTQ